MVHGYLESQALPVVAHDHTFIPLYVSEDDQFFTTTTGYYGDKMYEHTMYTTLYFPCRKDGEYILAYKMKNSLKC